MRNQGAVSLNFLHDFTLFVVDIHQIRLISLFPTPFDHFHFHGSAGLVPKFILTPCHTYIQYYIIYIINEVSGAHIHFENVLHCFNIYVNHYTIKHTS